jgi:hypothetical protein
MSVVFQNVKAMNDLNLTRISDDRFMKPVL